MDFLNTLLLLTTSTTSSSTSSSFDFAETLFKGIAGTVKGVASYIVTIIGILLIIAGVVQLAKALASSGRGVNWVAVLGCILVGGIFAIGGFQQAVIGNYLAGAGKGTFDSLMTGTTPSGVSLGEDTTPGAIGNPDPPTDGSKPEQTAYKATYTLIDGYVISFGKMMCVCIGALLVAICCYHVAKYFFKGGRTQVEWAKVLAMLLIGGAMFTGVGSGNELNDSGWKFVKDTAVGAVKDTVNNIADNKNQTDYAEPIDASPMDQWAQQQGSGGGSNNSTNTTTP